MVESLPYDGVNSWHHLSQFHDDFVGPRTSMFDANGNLRAHSPT